MYSEPRRTPRTVRGEAPIGFVDDRNRRKHSREVTINRIERGLRGIDAFQQRHVLLAFVFAWTKKFGDDNGGALAVQLTYAFFVTLFPLLLLLITILGIVLAGNPSAEHRVLNSTFAQFPVVGSDLRGNVHALRRGSAFGLVVGILGLLYGTRGLAQTGMYAMEQIWDIPSTERPSYGVRLLRSVVFLVVLAVGLVVTTAVSGFGTFGRHNVWLGIVGEAVAVVVNVGLYVATFRVLTPRSVETHSLLPGAIVGGVLWTVLQAVGGYVVGHDLKGASAIYGLFAVVLGLIAWIALGVQLTLYAAELNAVLANRLWPRSLVQPPLTEADQRALTLQVIENRRRPEEIIETHFEPPPMTEDEFRARGYRQDDAAGGAGAPTDVDPEP
jgi:YihY family inner membrane protein